MFVIKPQLKLVLVMLIVNMLVTFILNHYAYYLAFQDIYKHWFPNREYFLIPTPEASCDMEQSNRQFKGVRLPFFQSKLRGLKCSDRWISELVQQQQQMLSNLYCLQGLTDIRLLIMGQNCLDSDGCPPASSGKEDSHSCHSLNFALHTLFLGFEY